MQVVKAIFFGLAGEVAQVCSKVGDQCRKRAEAWIRIVTVMNAENVIGRFSGGFGDCPICHRQPSFFSMLEQEIYLFGE